MLDRVSQFGHELIARTTGPLALRFLLQPSIAIFFAVRDGVKDARARKPAYFWALFTHHLDRADLLRSGWKSVGKVFVMAVVMDIVYQAIASDRIRILQAIVVAMALALIPYLAFRGPINRIIRRLGI